MKLFVGISRRLHCAFITHLLPSQTRTFSSHSALLNMTGAKRDSNTLSNYDVFRTRHIRAAFNIDFSKRILKGGVILRLEAVQKGNEVVLDTSHLDLSNVTVDGDPAEWHVEPRSEPLGSALKVKLGREIDLGEIVHVAVSKGGANWRLNW